MVDDLYAEIVRIRPKDAAAQRRLLEIRDEMVQSYRDNFPGFVSCRLLAPEEGGTWVDLWYWRSKAAAEDALANTSKTPLFEEWGTLVEMVAFEWAAVVSDH
ncbi:MAG: antibiotic biosynthesis monooxygenase [Solirubrobacterales bacterium]